MTYAILFNPGHNRVYFETSLKLSVSEFNIVAQKSNAQVRTIAGIEYLTFDTDTELTQSEIKILSDLSFIYALFMIEGEYFKPVAKLNDDFVDDSISTILKYSGKTNEIFTRMMINVGYYSQTNTQNIRLLDPLAGKGTTLYEGLIKGYNVYGIEIGDGVVNESYHFLHKFLETAKYKFETTSIKTSGANKSYTALRHTFETAKTKEDFKNKNTRTIEMIAGNSMYADKFYKKNFFDLIVGDLPYGVQHSNVTNEKQSSMTRNPTELLNACLPSWLEVLKPGGVVVLSWNVNVVNRKQMEQIFAEHGLNVKNDGAYSQFEHRVDQAIVRDLVVGQSPLSLL